MINVGFHFDIDKSRLGSYGKDYLVAMTAATFPWIFCSLYFMFALGSDYNVPWRHALVAGRFAAPTSAGILFTMLEAAGMSETWLFQKARILAIFDDLDTLLLMVPLKAIIVGVRWELSIDLVWVLLSLVLMYVFLHRLNMSARWYAVAFYALLITAVCEVVHLVTSHDGIDRDDLAETVHLEVLLPAFAIGCSIKNENLHEHEHEQKTPDAASSTRPASLSRSMSRALTRGAKKVRDMRQETFKLVVSAIFMVLVGLSMPSLFNEEFSADALASAHRRSLAASTSASGSSTGCDESHGSGNGTALMGTEDANQTIGSDCGGGPPPMSAGILVLHVLACTLLMNLGKLFPALCYRDEANFKTRLALAIGMMPRGEVCAGIIVNAIALGTGGECITIAVLCLAVNMTCVSGFIFLVKQLSQAGDEADVVKVFDVAAVTVESAAEARADD
jgi:Kef-type K+ transport system membrane component KefB